MSILKTITITTASGITGSILYHKYTKEEDIFELNHKPSFDFITNYFNKGFLIGMITGYFFIKKIYKI